MLLKTLCRQFKESKNLTIYENKAMNAMSGISATVFGATGFLGNIVVPTLGLIGSDVICPSNHLYWHSDKVKELRLAANVGYIHTNHHTNFNDPKTIRRMVEKSNTVINCIGPRRNFSSYEQFREVNINLPRKIARESRQAGVKRLIHFSNVAVDPNSPSYNLATKFEGEKYVLEEFPDATIFRMSTVIGLNDFFTRLFRTQVNLFNNFYLVYSDLQAKRQPILATDVAECVIAALKLPESKGQIYELGGPHVYTLHELFDVMTNCYRRKISYAHLNKDLMSTIAKNVISTEYFCYDDIVSQSIDMYVTGRPGLKSIKDLYYQPVSVIPWVEFDINRFGEVLQVVKDDEHAT